MKTVHILAPHLFNIHFNIILFDSIAATNWPTYLLSSPLFTAADWGLSVRDAEFWKGLKPPYESVLGNLKMRCIFDFTD
jgi:hypothetical protein